VPLDDPVVIVTTQMNRVLAVDRAVHIHEPRTVVRAEQQCPGAIGEQRRRQPGTRHPLVVLAGGDEER
jgi:hypothetical protein